MTERRKTIVLVAGIAVLGVLSFGISGAAPAGDAVFTQDNETPTPTPTPNATNATVNQTNVTSQMANVTFENQTSNGTAVMVNSTVLPNGGVLVVYNQTMAAPLGNSSFLQNGTQENVSVTLNESLTENQTLVVAAFNDTDGNQQFDLGTDEVYVAQGQPVVAAATVNVTAADNVTTPTPAANATTPTPTDNVTTPAENETTPTPEQEADTPEPDEEEEEDEV